jgi:16S rRNA (guanine966-N2)-methyltransferase
MRIVGGRFRGRALAAVGKGDAAAHLRPTTDRVREALFNVLEHRFGGFDTANVLDVFAGSGALGLEALSRGASHVTFVENGRAGANLITRNIAQLGVADQAKLLRRDALKLGNCETDLFDIAFLDPPYGKAMGTRALEKLVSGGWLKRAALIVLEEGASAEFPLGITLQDARRYGDTHIHIGEFA